MLWEPPEVHNLVCRINSQNCMIGSSTILEEEETKYHRDLVVQNQCLCDSINVIDSGKYFLLGSRSA